MLQPKLYVCHILDELFLLVAVQCILGNVNRRRLTAFRRLCRSQFVSYKLLYLSDQNNEISALCVGPYTHWLASKRRNFISFRPDSVANFLAVCLFDFEVIQKGVFGRAQSLLLVWKGLLRQHCSFLGFIGAISNALVLVVFGLLNGFHWLIHHSVFGLIALH
jgi:hypothetical protein